MKARVVALVALAAAVTLTSVAAAGPAAAKQRVAIDMKICSPGKSQGTFVLTPLQAGPLKRDSGAIDSNWLSIIGRDVMRDGQEVTIYDGAVTTLTGKRGTGRDDLGGAQGCHPPLSTDRGARPRGRAELGATSSARATRKPSFRSPGCASDSAVRSRRRS